jgi:hypothetical protein
MTETHSSKPRGKEFADSLTCINYGVSFREISWQHEQGTGGIHLAGKNG